MNEGFPKSRTNPSGLDPFVGPICGLAAGGVYLAAQMMFAAAFHGGAGWEPLQRIAAILLGSDAAPPGPVNFTIVGMALLIHGGLSIVYGCIVAAAVRSAPRLQYILGALIGVGIYGLNYQFIAPHVFPWFVEASGWTTWVDHLLFGVIAAGVASVCVLPSRTAAPAS